LKSSSQTIPHLGGGFRQAGFPQVEFPVDVWRMRCFPTRILV
jgi:hypothetical protein